MAMPEFEVGLHIYPKNEFPDPTSDILKHQVDLVFPSVDVEDIVLGKSIEFIIGAVSAEAALMSIDRMCELMLVSRVLESYKIEKLRSTALPPSG